MSIEAEAQSVDDISSAAQPQPMPNEPVSVLKNESAASETKWVFRGQTNSPPRAGASDRRRLESGWQSPATRR
jgi:hypothetical protein